MRGPTQWSSLFDSKFTALLVLEGKMADSGRTLCTVALGSKIALSETRYTIENLLLPKYAISARCPRMSAGFGVAI